MSLTKSQILAHNDVDVVRVDVPQWDGFVYVRSMSAAERNAFSQKFSGESLDGLQETMCVLTVCDENGQRIFTDDDVAALGEKSGAALDLICQAAQKLNKMDAESVEEAEKNL